MCLLRLFMCLLRLFMCRTGKTTYSDQTYSYPNDKNIRLYKIYKIVRHSAIVFRQFGYSLKLFVPSEKYIVLRGLTKLGLHWSNWHADLQPTPPDLQPSPHLLMCHTRFIAGNYSGFILGKSSTHRETFLKYY